MVIGNSIVARLRRCPTIWRNFFSQYKTINLGIGGDLVENVLWCINNMVLPKSVRSVVIHCDTNNIGTSSSDEISLGVITIAKSISHCYPNIEGFVSGLLPTDIHWSAQGSRICAKSKMKTNAYLREYCEKSNKITLMRQDQGWTLPDNSLNIELFYKDHFHLYNWKPKHQILKLNYWNIEGRLSTQSSSQLSSLCLSQSLLIIAPPPSFLSKSNLLSVQTLF